MNTYLFNVQSERNPQTFYRVWGPVWQCDCPAVDRCKHQRIAEYLHRMGLSDPHKTIQVKAPPNIKWYRSDEAKALLDPTRKNPAPASTGTGA